MNKESEVWRSFTKAVEEIPVKAMTLGIDVSKAKLDAALWIGTSHKSYATAIARICSALVR